MHASPYERITRQTFAQWQLKRAVVVLLLVSFFTNLALALTLLFRVDESKTVILSAADADPYIATSDSVSANLLERFGVSALGLVMTMTPTSAAWQIETFLKSVAPEGYGALASTLQRGAEEMKRLQASSVFYARSSTVDPIAKRVCLSGDRRTVIAQSVTSNRPVTVCLDMTVRAGRIWILALRQSSSTQSVATHSNPVAVPAVESPAPLDEMLLIDSREKDPS